MRYNIVDCTICNFITQDALLHVCSVYLNTLIRICITTSKTQTLTRSHALRLTLTIHTSLCSVRHLRLGILFDSTNRAIGIVFDSANSGLSFCLRPHPPPRSHRNTQSRRRAAWRQSCWWWRKTAWKSSRGYIWPRGGRRGGDAQCCWTAPI